MEAAGWAGFVAIQLCYVPQTIRMLRTRQASGLSLAAWTLLWLGNFFYLLYAVAIGDLIYTVGFSAGLLHTSLQIGLILKLTGTLKQL